MCHLLLVYYIILIHYLCMHNLHAIFAKFHGICKQFGKTLVDEKGNQSRREVVPRFSNLEVIALSLPAESLGIDSESYLFAKLSECHPDSLENQIVHTDSTGKIESLLSFYIFRSKPVQKSGGVVNV